MNDETQPVIPDLRFPEFLNDGQWEIKTFEKLFKIGNGRDYKHLSKGDIPVYGSGGYMLSVNDFLYDGESVCIGRKGTIDKPMFLKGKFWTVDTLFYTYDFKDCTPKFINFIFQDIDWRRHNEAGGVPSLSKTNIYKIKIFVPELLEQQKIASCLSSLDELIIAQKEKLELLKNHKKGLMQNLFPQEGETVPKFHFPEFENDGEWEEKKLGDMCRSISAGKNKNSDNGAFYLYGSTGIIGNCLDPSHNGTFILVARVGANAGFLNKIAGEFGVTDNTLILDLDEQYNLNYIYYFLEKFNLNKLVFGSGQPLITGSQLKKILIPISKNKLEQQKISSCLSSLDEIITSRIEKIEKLQLHKRGLLQGLFPKIID